MLLLAAVLLTGCASEPSAVSPVTIPQNTGSASAALVFDAPITMGSPYIDIPRDDRGQAALLGYDEATVSAYAIVTDNRQANDGSEGFVRESFTQRSGVTHR